VFLDNGDPGESGDTPVDLAGHEFTEHDATLDGAHLADPLAADDHGLTDLVEPDHLAEPDHDEVEPAGELWTPHAPLPSGGAASTTDDSHGISVDTGSGSQDIGPATVDTDADGTPDTAVVHDANGDLIMYTDTDGDGHADVAVEINPNGDVVIAHHTGADGWTEVQTGHLDGSGTFHPDSSGGAPFEPPLPGRATGFVADSTSADAAADAYWDATSPQPEPADAQQELADHRPEDGGPVASAATVSAMFAKGQGVVRIDAATGQWISPN
jgi:hypothetical protein